MKNSTFRSLIYVLLFTALIMHAYNRQQGTDYTFKSSSGVINKQTKLFKKIEQVNISSSAPISALIINRSNSKSIEARSSRVARQFFLLFEQAVSNSTSDSSSTTIFSTSTQETST